MANLSSMVSPYLFPTFHQISTLEKTTCRQCSILLDSTQLIGSAWACEHERITKKYNQTRSEKLDCCPKNGPSHPKYCWNVSRHPTKPPGNNILNHIERTSSITRIDVSNHLPSDRTRLKTQLTPQPSVQTQKTRWARQLYNPNGHNFNCRVATHWKKRLHQRKDKTRPVSTKWINTVEKLYRQSKTNRRSKRHKTWKTTSTTKFLTFNRWEQTSMHPKPVVPQLIFTTRRYRAQN